MTLCYIILGLSFASGLVALVLCLRWSEYSWDRNDKWQRRKNIAANFLFGWTGIMVIWCFILGAVTIAQAISNRNCGYAQKQYQKDTKWDFWAGCFIEVNGRYISIDNYRAIIEDNDR